MPAGTTRKWLRECIVPIAPVIGRQLRSELRCSTIYITHIVYTGKAVYSIPSYASIGWARACVVDGQNGLRTLVFTRVWGAVPSQA